MSTARIVNIPSAVDPFLPPRPKLMPGQKLPPGIASVAKLSRNAFGDQAVEVLRRWGDKDDPWFHLVADQIEAEDQAKRSGEGSTADPQARLSGVAAG